jgi:hypothetical protein
MIYLPGDKQGRLQKATIGRAHTFLITCQMNKLKETVSQLVDYYAKEIILINLSKDAAE